MWGLDNRKPLPVTGRGFLLSYSLKGYFLDFSAACAAASLAIGTLKGEHET